MMSSSMLLMGPSSLPTDPTHSAIDSSSGASSSMQADTREVVKVAVFEASVRHLVDEMRRFFAMAAAYRSGTPRPYRSSTCYCILVSGTSLQTLISQFAIQRVLKERAWRDPGWAGRVTRRARQAPSL